MKALGGFLGGSEWANAFINAYIASSITAESFLKVRHLAKAGRAHAIVNSSCPICSATESTHDYMEAVSTTTEASLGFNKWCCYTSQLKCVF